MIISAIARLAGAGATVALCAAGALVLTAPAAAGAESDYVCDAYVSAPMGAVLGTGCSEEPGDTAQPVRLYVIGALSVPVYTCEQAFAAEGVLTAFGCAEP